MNYREKAEELAGNWGQSSNEAWIAYIERALREAAAEALEWVADNEGQYPRELRAEADRIRRGEG